MRHVLLVAGVVVAASGCSLFLSTAEFTGGGDEPKPDSSDAGSIGDAPIADAPAQADGDAAPGRPFCASKSPSPTLCSDFDTATAPEQEWEYESTIPATSTLVLDRSAFVSSSTSLRAIIPAGVPGTNDGYASRVGYVAKVPAKKSVHAETKLRVDAVDGTTQAHLVWLQFEGRSIYLMMSRKESTLRLDDAVVGNPSFRMPLAKPIPLGRWAKVDIDLTIGDTTTVTARLDGEVVAGPVEIDKTVTLAPPGFSIGPAYYTTATVEAAEAHFDDALLDVQ